MGRTICIGSMRVLTHSDEETFQHPKVFGCGEKMTDPSVKSQPSASSKQTSLKTNKETQTLGHGFCLSS